MVIVAPALVMIFRAIGRVMDVGSDEIDRDESSMDNNSGEAIFPRDD